MKKTTEKSVRGLLSPSNVAAATLVGFLFAGHFTDWKMLRRRPSKSELLVSPGISKRPSQPVAPATGTGHPRDFETKPESEVADSRVTIPDGKSRPRLD